MGKQDAEKGGLTEARVKELIAAGALGFVTEVQLKELLAAAVQPFVSEKEVTELIVAAIHNYNEQLATKLSSLITEEKAQELLLGLATKDQVIELFNQEMRTLAGEAHQILNDGGEIKPSLDPSWLEGLTFVSSKRQKTKPGERPMNVPVERDLTISDVLSFSIGEDAVTIIAGDGQKHVVML